MEAMREQGVWSRVAAPIRTGQSQEELKILLMNAKEVAGLIQGIQAKPLRSRQTLRQMQEWEQANLASLKGMLVFAGQEVRLSSGNPSPTPAKQSLSRIFYLAKKAAQEYTARSVDPEFGIVYQEMAGRESRICNGAMQLLGELFL